MKAGLVAPLLAPMARDLAARLAANLLAYGLAALLLATAAGFLVATLYLGLAELVEPVLATLLTAMVLGATAALILLAVRHRRPPQRDPGAGGVDALLLSMREQVQRDPWSTLIAAAVLGALAEITTQSSSSRPPS